jgi:hypothetical protein
MYNGQKKKYKKTNNDLQNIIHKTKDRVTRTPLKAGGELRCSGRMYKVQDWDILYSTACLTFYSYLKNTFKTTSF